MAAPEQRSVALANREVAYEVEGVQVKLTPGLIRTYLVRGKGNLVTDQEVVFFMGICQARKLNPLAGDCYLVKYSDDPAAIITAVEFLRARARSSLDCQGWSKGIIVKGNDGRIRDSHGLLLDGDILLGGWFEATPKGWDGKFRLEVNLRGYIKKTSTGSITKFWSPDNQPTMIAKVAEAQGLRTLWPRDCSRLFVPGEIPAPDEFLDSGLVLDGLAGEMVENGKGLQADNLERIANYNQFMAKKTAQGAVVIGVSEYKEATAKRSGITLTELEAHAGSSPENFNRFWSGFQKWTALNKNKGQGRPQEAQEGQEEADSRKGVTMPPQGTKAQGQAGGDARPPEKGTPMPGFDQEKEPGFILCPDFEEHPEGFCPPCSREGKIMAECPRATEGQAGRGK
jgi:phage recombination protein Bet